MSGAAMAESEIEYESDPEEANLSLKMRRREASDDEEVEERDIVEKPPRRVDDSDGESEGAPADYEEDEFEGEEYDLDEEDYAEEIEEVGYEESGGKRGEDDGVKTVVAVERAEEAGKDDGEVKEEEEKRVNKEEGEVNDENSNNNWDGQQHDEGENKEIEPYAVPTAGAFYMHDDRFRDNAGGRHRRMLGGRKLWESKDDRKWGHDKFEEFTVQERTYGEQRRGGSRGRNRGRGRNRAADRGYAQGSRPREYTNNSTQNNNNQNIVPKSVRGRGPQRYRPSFKKETPLTLNKQSGKSVEKTSNGNSVRNGESISNNAAGDVILPRKQVSASNLNIASPPFYPSGSSSKDSSLHNKRDVQAGGSFSRNGQPSVVTQSFSMGLSSGMRRGKSIVDSIGVDKLYIDDSLSAMAGKPANTISGPSSINSSQQQLRGQASGAASLTQMAYQPAVFNNQTNRVNPTNQLQTSQRNPGQSHASSLQASGQKFTRGSQTTPQKTNGPGSAVESGELESTSESNKTKTALVPKGKGSIQGGERGSFLYGGAQVMGSPGNIGSGHGDQNFPAFLPVMQFGGQHPGGIPAVGMAFPGYVGRPQLGLGNSEMTWMPVLAGAAGALGARYGPPYASVDGSHHARPSGQMSSVMVASSKENNANNGGNDRNLAQRPEVANDDVAQKQKIPRRYTEMKFDQ